jgi:N utilization substance protein B
LLLTKSPGVQNRRRARELAVQFLDSLETRSGHELDESLNAFLSEDGFACGEEKDVKEYLSFLVAGVWRERAGIDNTMRRIVTGWRPERMVAVDRAVLRMAIFEGFMAKKIPVAVAISEAVSLAVAFGTEDSGKFVNGVLAKAARYFTGAQEAVPDAGSDLKRKEEKNAAADSEIPVDC